MTTERATLEPEIPPTAPTAPTAPTSRPRCSKRLVRWSARLAIALAVVVGGAGLGTVAAGASVGVVGGGSGTTITISRWNPSIEGVDCRSDLDRIEVSLYPGNWTWFRSRVWVHNTATNQTWYVGERWHAPFGAQSGAVGPGGDRSVDVWPATYQVYVQLLYPSGQVIQQGWITSYRNIVPTSRFSLYSYASRYCEIR